MQHPTYVNVDEFYGPKSSKSPRSHKNFKSSIPTLRGLNSPSDLLKGEIRRRRGKMYTLFSLGISLSLSGCMGIYEEGFECPPGKGVGCKSISEVNHMVNEGVLGRRVVKEAPSRGSHLMVAHSMGYLSQGTHGQSASSPSSDCESCTSHTMVQGSSTPSAMSLDSMSPASSGEPQIWYAPIEWALIQWKPPQGSISKVDSSRTLSDQSELTKTEPSQRGSSQQGGEA